MSKPSHLLSANTVDYLSGLNIVLTSPVESSYYEVAKYDPKWIAALDAELRALEANQIWELTISMILDVNGSIRPNLIQMELYRDARIGWLQGVISR